MICPRLCVSAELGLTHRPVWLWGKGNEQRSEDSGGCKVHWPRLPPCTKILRDPKRTKLVDQIMVCPNLVGDFSGGREDHHQAPSGRAPPSGEGRSAARRWQDRSREWPAWGTHKFVRGPAGRRGWGGGGAALIQCMISARCQASTEMTP